MESNIKIKAVSHTKIRFVMPHDEVTLSVVPRDNLYHPSELISARDEVLRQLLAAGIPEAT